MDNETVPNEKPRGRKYFRGLTKAQSDGLGLVAMNEDYRVKSRTLSALESLHLVEHYWEIDNGRPAIRFKRYRVASLAVHIEWCEWCAKNFDEDGNWLPVEVHE